MSKKEIIFPKPKDPVSLSVQDFHVRKSFPSFELYRNGPIDGYWIGFIKPRENGSVYKIKIQYRHKKSPKVFVLDPILLGNSPHQYRDGSLCLYYPPDNSCNKKSLIADTIIPWTSEWLYFYEIWQNTGVWWGREAPHTPINDIDDMEDNIV